MIHHTFTPTVVVTTDDDGTNPRLKAVDWAGSYIDSSHDAVTIGAAVESQGEPPRLGVVIPTPHGASEPGRDFVWVNWDNTANDDWDYVAHMEYIGDLTVQESSSGENAATEWLDSLTPHLTAAIEAVCTQPGVYANVPYVYVNDQDKIRVSATADTLAIELNGEPRVGLLFDDEPFDGHGSIHGDPTLVVWTGPEGQDDSVAIHLGYIDLNGTADEVAAAIVADITH